MALKFLGATAGVIIPASAGLGKILTSDASGNGTWAAPGKVLTGNAITVPSASFSTVVTTVVSYTPGAGEIVAGSSYRIRVRAQVINAASGTLTAALAVGVTNICFFSGTTLGAAAFATPGRPMLIEGTISFASTTSVEGNLEFHLGSTITSGTSSDTTNLRAFTTAPIAITAGTAININMNTGASTSTIIVREASISRIF